MAGRTFINGKEVIVAHQVELSGDLNMSGDIELTGGGSITTTANGDIALLPHGTGITKVGDAGSTSHSLAANDDLFVNGKLEVDGTLYADGIISAADDIQMGAGKEISGGGAPSTLGAFQPYNSWQTLDGIAILTGSVSNILLFAEFADRTFDFAHTQQTNPTIMGHSANSSTTEWWSKTHDQTDSVEGIGKGSKVTNHEAPVSLADDAEFGLPDASAGFGFIMCGDGEEYAQVCWTSAGVVTLVANSANVVNTDTDTNLCIYDSGTQVKVKNRLGAAKTVTFDYHYTTSP